MATLIVPAQPAHVRHRVMEDHDDAREVWDALADELVELIAVHLVPGCTEDPWRSRPLSDMRQYYADRSVGAAHWCQLSKALTRRGQWLDALRKNRRSHAETAACCRVLESRATGAYDWPLAVLKLRGLPAQPCRHSEASLLSHTMPIARHTLRQAYWAVAKEVHPDRLSTPLATDAMTVLNEAYRQAVLQFSVREPDVIRLDALGLEHDGHAIV